MLPLMVLLGLGWLGWWFARHIVAFPREFAGLLDDGGVRRGPLAVLTGRSTVTGTLQGRPVTMFFQPAGEHQTGRAVVAIRTTAINSTSIPARSRAADDVVDAELERALNALRDAHELQVELDAGWLRVTWQPIGFFIFPGRFDRTKWQDVLANLCIVASRLEVQSDIDFNH